MYIDIHALQSVPPSNLNRDDSGSPKTATYGGVLRHRVSSQSWKKAIRDHYNAATGNQEGFRTLNVVELAVKRAQETRPHLLEDVNFEEKIKSVFVTSGVMKSGKTQSSALFFISLPQIDSALDIVEHGDPTDKKSVRDAFLHGNSLTLALFGRMVADNTSLNVEASCQFAHAISTHAVASEYDFFTAVDDFAQTDHAGGAMLGDVEFVSSTLYRYASINLDALKENFDDHEALPDAIANFLDSFTKAIPSGKQNTFAALTLPSGLIISLRNAPLSFASAFETPVRPSTQGGITEASKKALSTYAQRTYAEYDTSPKEERWVGFDHPENTLTTLKDTLRTWVQEA